MQRNEATKKKLDLKKLQNERLNNVVLSLKADLIRLKDEERRLYSLETSTTCSHSHIRKFFGLVLKMIMVILNACSFLFFLVFIFIELDGDCPKIETELSK